MGYMAYILDRDGHTAPAGDVASGGGYAFFCDWVDGLDETGVYRELVHLREHGCATKLDELAKALRQGLQEEQPEDDVASTCNELLGILGNNPDADMLIVSDGVGVDDDDDGEPADNEDDPPAEQEEDEEKRPSPPKKTARARKRKQRDAKAALKQKKPRGQAVVVRKQRSDQTDHEESQEEIKTEKVKGGPPGACQRPFIRSGFPLKQISGEAFGKQFAVVHPNGRVRAWHFRNCGICEHSRETANGRL